MCPITVVNNLFQKLSDNYSVNEDVFCFKDLVQVHRKNLNSQRKKYEHIWTTEWRNTYCRVHGLFHYVEMTMYAQLFHVKFYSIYTGEQQHHSKLQCSKMMTSAFYLYTNIWLTYFHSIIWSKLDLHFHNGIAIHVSSFSLCPLLQTWREDWVTRNTLRGI